MSIVVGQTVAGFEIIGHLGSGGMGDVFRARDPKLGRDVAVKVVSSDAAPHPDRLARLRREARLLASLSHPSIAAIYGIEDVDGVPLLILELIDGPTLQSRLAAGPPLAMAEALKLASQLAYGVAAAHAKGVVHRDLKPGNIKLPSEGHLKILDFGIAKALDTSDDEGREDEPTAALTQEGAIFGTAPYMSPEQVRGTTVDRVTDVWAFGCVVFETLAGRRAFANVAAVLEREPDWSRLPESPPREVRDLLRRCVNKDAAKRPRDLADAAQLLEELAVGIASGRLPVGGDTRRRLVYAGVAALLAAGIGVAVIGWPRARMASGREPVIASTPTSSRLSVAVLTLRNLSGNDETRWIGTALGETISADLRAADTVRVIPGERVVTMSRDLDLLDTEAYTANTLNRFRGILGCDLVVTGAYLVSGDRVRADLRIQDARTGELVSSVSETGAVADLIDLTSKLGGRLRPVLGLSNSDSRRGEARTVLPASADAARLYAAGLARLRAFEPAGARPLLERAAVAEPDNALIHLALSRTWSALGNRARATAEAQRALDLAPGLPWENRLAIEGRHAELSGNQAGAIDAYAKLLTQHPDDLDAGLQLAAARRAAGKPRDALGTIDTLRKLPPPLGDDARLDLEEASTWQAMSDAPKALAAAARGVARADASGSRLLLARAYNTKASAQILNADYEQAKASAREAQRAAEAVGDKTTVARALRNIGVACYYNGDPDCFVRNSEQALLIGKEIGDREIEANSLGNMSAGEVLLGRTAQAIQHETEALAIRIELGDLQMIATSRHNLCELYQAVGELAKAEASYREGIEIFTKAGDRGGVAAEYSGLGDIAAARGEGAARTEYERAIKTRSELGLQALVAASKLAYGTYLLGVAPREAEPLLKEAAATFREVKDRDREAWAVGFLGRAQLALGRRDEALRTIDAARAIGDRAAYFRARLTFQMNQAVVQASSGRPDDVERARKTLASLLQEAVDHGMVNRQIELRLELGRVERLSPATAAAGKTRLQGVAKDAKARQFHAIAKAAAAALAS